LEVQYYTFQPAISVLYVR